MPPQAPAKNVMDILWESLEGGEYDLAALKRKVDADTNLQDFLDSLDLTDFVLRLEHYFQINIAQEDYPRLASLSAVEAYIREHSPLLARA